MTMSGRPTNENAMVGPWSAFLGVMHCTGHSAA
jgi:hypothetical protein